MEENTCVTAKPDREKKFLGIILDELGCLEKAMICLGSEIDELSKVSGVIPKDCCKEEEKPPPATTTDKIRHDIKDITSRVQEFENSMRSIKTILIN